MSPDRRRTLTARTLFAATFALAVLAPLLAAARPGGGGSFSGGGGGGGGGGYSGGGSGGGGLAIFELIVLCFEHPLLGLIVLVVIGVIFGSNAIKGATSGGWSTGAPVARQPPRQRVSVRRQLESIRRHDDGFSIALFEDFLYALYAQVQTARGTGAMGGMSAYLGPNALASSGLDPHTPEARAQGELAEVKTIIVGSLRFDSVSLSNDADPLVRVVVRFETNYTEVSRGGHEQAWYADESWTLARRASAKSRPPDKARTIACPNCGAPLEGVIAARCKYCGKDVATGEFDWVVVDIRAMRQPRGPMLTAMEPEVGTNDPTVIDPEAETRLKALFARDPALTWDAFQARLGLVFNTFQTAWSARDLASMRPFLSDNLFDVETYWTRAYQAQGLHNMTQNARITQIDLARVTSDKYFDSITVRLFATSLDYTVEDRSGHVVCGSRSRERAYTEYWTFLRSTRASGPARTDRACPNCGAPLAITMAGHCSHCNAKVTGGAFDWVLSRIEQDESYGG